MGSTTDFIQYVCNQLRGCGEVRYRKMFGEYIVYVNDKPLLLVCDNTVFVKQLTETDAILSAEGTKSFPYEGAKAHYIIDADDRDLLLQVIAALEPITPLPKARKKKA